MESPATLDPQDYVILPGVAVLDEHHLVRPGVDQLIDSVFLQEICDTANRREQDTGDLSPYVIGHINLSKGTPEVEQPRVVGYARNWYVGPLFDTGRMAAKNDFWLKRQYLNEVRDYPRRSAELWVDRREIDPISLLGATVPHRDLGPLPVAMARPVTLSRDLGPLPRDPAEPPVECPMPEPMPTAPKTSPDDKSAPTVSNTEIKELLNQLVAMITEMKGGGPKPDAAPPAGPGAPGSGEMSDQELEALLGGMGGEEKPVQNGFAMPGPTNSYTPTPKQPDAQMQRVDKIETENAQLRTQLARIELNAQLEALERKGVSIPDKDEEIADLLALPPDRRVARLARIAKLPSAPVGRGVIGAVQHAINDQGQPGKDRGLTEDEDLQVQQLAREGRTSYEAAHFKKFGTYPYGHSGRPR